MPIHPHLHQLVFLGLWLAACAYALAAGGTPERITAAALLAAAQLTRAAQSGLSELYRGVEAGILAVDVALLATLLAVALWSTRFWPMLMTSMQGAEVLGHVAKLLAPDTMPRAYYAVVAMWSLPMLALLAAGTLRHRRRLRRYGIDPAWSGGLPAPYRDGEPLHD